jgi:nucleoside-diphosphate-sugar epimerase
MEMSKIALFGGGGSIGHSIADALRAEGQSYRVVGRSKAALEPDFGSDPLAEIVAWNPSDPTSVRAAARGVETIVYMVGVPYTDFRLHPVLMKQTVDGAIAEGVKQLILIGTVYPYGRPRTMPVREDHPREPHTFKGRMRKEQEDLLLAADAAGSIRGTILRLPDFYGPNVELSFLWGTFRAAVEGKRAQMVGPIDTPHEFVYVPDVGPVVTALAREERAYGKWWNLAGAGTVTQREMAERIFAEVGRNPKLMVANKLMLRALGLFNPFMREMVEMHYLLTDPVIMDDSALRELLGKIKKTSYEEGIKRTLAAMRIKDTRQAAGNTVGKIA